MGRKKGSGSYSREKIEKMIFEKHGDRVVIDFSTYGGTDKTCRFFDKDYGEFWNIPYNVYKCGQGHRRRFNKLLKKDYLDMQKKIDAIFNGEITIVPESYVNSHTKCEFVDKVYGKFWAYPHNILNHKQRHPDFKMSEDYRLSHSRAFKYSIEDCLKKDTPRRNQVRGLILENNLIKYICRHCGQMPKWNGKELILQLHHINGICTDNRLENLCFLCPNCHTQTETYYRGLKNEKI